MPAVIHHALVLNLHQPSGNLQAMLTDAEWEVRQILCAIDRIPRSLWGREGLGQVHLSLSGTLLEALSEPAFQEQVYGIVKLGDLLWYLQNERIIEVLGTGYYHPVLPLIPAEDRHEQMARWLGLARHLFWRGQFQGFWPPEMAFSMELIPLLCRHGYRYVLVDAEYITPLTPMKWHEVRYRPHLARHGGAEVVVIPRDRELSMAQESGMEPDWFIREVRDRTRWCGFPPLVTTATDGDNGGWFRNLTPGRNFWEAFYLPMLDRVASGAVADLRPVFIRDYLDHFGPGGEVTVRTGAWNTGEHSGVGFVQWTGSERQKAAWARLAEVSDRVRDARSRITSIEALDAHRAHLIEEAYWRVLKAETSCHFFWGEAWVDRCHRDLDEALAWLGKAERRASP